jgi:hypothetical protein
MKNNQWYAIRGQSLAKYVRYAGFDLALYDDYDKKVQVELRKRAVIEALWAIKTACWEQGFNVDTVKSGVYVIALSNPLSIQYRRKQSQVIYVGRGNIMGRIKTHFERKLFDFMLGLSGANFDFYFAKPTRPGTKNYFMHVEHLMLDYFSSQYGGMDDKRRFPLLNKSAGNNRYYAPGTEWWKKPLKAQGKRPLWKLMPTDFSDFAPLDV